jgi:hypothetical protein
VALVGAGFALVQLPLVHRLLPLIGHPTQGPAVVLASLLFAGAAGALLGARARPQSSRHAIGWATLAAGLYAVALIELASLAGEALRGQPAATRLAGAVALAAPLGLCAGVPFAAIVRALAAAGRGAWAAYLWAVWWLASVVAGFLSLGIGVATGFGFSTALGALCLFGAFMMAGLRWLAPDTPPAEPATANEALPDDHAPFRRPTSRAV